MRYSVLSFLLLFMAAILNVTAQETVGGVPWGLRMALPMGDVPTVMAAPFDAQAAQADDEARDRDGFVPLYGRFCAIGVDPATKGRWQVLPNGDRIWRVRVTSPGALAMELFAEGFDLPVGGILHVYDEAGGQLLGGYTAYNRQPDGSFSTDMVYGDACILEYYEPQAVAGQGNFRFTQVAHAYRMVSNEAIEAQGTQRADPCQVDVNCTEGTQWQEQRDAVVRVRVVIPQGTGWCSGTLVNNTAQDCKPYILSALHCALGSTTANFNQYQFRFRYQRSGCGSGSIPVASGNTVTGCTKRADSNDNGGDSGSDFILLELNNPIPAGINPFYAGWSSLNLSSPNGVSIHHPAGSEKKISTYTASLSTSGWGQIGSHWRVIWTATANGHGVTEGGSSGSPIFDSNKRIVGTLTGGASCCEANACGFQTGPNAPDFYGKMSHHWSSNPNAANQKLRVWLDPAGTNVTTLDGSYTPCSLVGIAERAADMSPAVYPNPALDNFVVRYPEGMGRPELLEVMDITGRLVHSTTPTSTGQAGIDVRTWSAGSYMVFLVYDGLRSPGAKVQVGASLR